MEQPPVIEDERGVDFEVLGGFAAIIHGSPLPTEDIDVIPSREDLIVAVADLDDIIASKVAANRPKDQRALPYLESLRDQLA